MLKRWWWVFLVMAPIGPVLGLFTAAVVTYVMPKKYESRARIEVHPGHVDGKAAAGPHLGTECETITSHKLLAKVIGNLDLTNQWGLDGEAAVNLLDGMVTAKEVKGTDLIDVRVRSTDREAARDIALEVVRTYKEYRREIETREPDRVLGELKKTVRAQEERVETLRQELADLVRNRGVGVGGDDGKALDGAKERAAAEQDKLEQMKLKVLWELPAARDRYPYERMIMHDDPVIAQSPASPNVALNLIAGTVLGLLLALPLALLAVWLLERMVPKKVVQQSLGAQA